MKRKLNIPLIIGIVLILIGSFLPSIKIADENINFIKESGPIIIILTAIMAILLRLDKKILISIPSILSIGIIIKFMTNNSNRLKTIRETYKCYTGFQYGLSVMMIGNILILISIILTITNFTTIVSILKNILEKVIEKIKNIKPKKIKTTNIIKPKLIEKLSKKENKNKITSETTKDGKIRFKKITVNVNNKEKTTKLKEKLNLFILKHRIRKISKKKIAITKYNEEKKTTYYIPRINIKKWTRNNICCINCGATVSENSEYCFLCDCKIKLKDNKEKIS